MDKVKKSYIFRAISLVLILTFISLDISFAYPPEHNTGTSTLAAPSNFQQQPIGGQAVGLSQSIFSQGSLLGSACSIADYLLKDGLPLKHLEQVISAELGSAAQGVSLSQVTFKDGVVLIPYEIDNKEEVMQIALKNTPAADHLKGEELFVSDKYVMKKLPDVNTIVTSIMQDLAEIKEISMPGLFNLVVSKVPEEMRRLRNALEDLRLLSGKKDVSVKAISEAITGAKEKYKLSAEETKILWLALTGPGQGMGQEVSIVMSPKEAAERHEKAHKAVVIGGGSGTNFFSEVMAKLGWQINRILTPFDDGGRTGKIQKWMKKHTKIKNFFAVGDLTKTLVMQASNSPSIQWVMDEERLENNSEGDLKTQTNKIINKLANEIKLGHLDSRIYRTDSAEFERFVIEVVNIASEFDKNFKNMDLNGHSLRHLIYLQCFWSEHMKHRSYQDAVKDGTRRFMDLLGIAESNAFLSSVDTNLGTLKAETANETIIGQANITGKTDLGLIKEFGFAKRVEPQASAEAISQIEKLGKGDTIILGPGSFYTSIICNLLPRGIVKAIADAKKRGAIPIFVFNPIYCNETKAMRNVQKKNVQKNTFVQMVKIIEKYIPGYKFDDLFEYCIVNDANANSPDIKYLMAAEGSKKGDREKFTRPDKLRYGAIKGKDGLVKYFNAEKYDVTVVSGDLMYAEKTRTGIEASYDPDTFSSILKALVRDNSMSKVPEIIVLSDTHATIDGLLRFKESLPGRVIFNNGDIIDRGDELWNLMKLIDYFTLGDHELWATGACLGHDYLLAMWLRSLYRYTMTTKILSDLGINTDNFVEFSRATYPDAATDYEKLKSAGKYGGPSSPEEQAMFNIWIKLAVREANRLKGAGKSIPLSIEDVLKNAKDMIGNGTFKHAKLESLELTDEEDRIFKGLKKEFLKYRPDQERSAANLVSHFLKGRVYQIVQPLPDIPKDKKLEDTGVSFHKPGEYPKALLLHANIPMDGMGNPVDLLGNIIPLESLRQYYDILNRNLAAFEERYRLFKDKMVNSDGESNDEFWDGLKLEGHVTDPKEWLMLLADSEYSPLFARKQTRIRTYLSGEDKEPDNIAYVFLTRNYKVDVEDIKDEKKKEDGKQKARLIGSKKYVPENKYSAEIIKTNLKRLYGLDDNDFTKEDGVLYLKNEGANEKIAAKLAEAFGVDTIILGHIGRDEKTGEPVKCANGKIWMIDGSFAEKQGTTGALAAKETGGFLLLRKKESSADTGIESGRLVRVGEIIENKSGEYDEGKPRLVSLLKLKDIISYKNVKLEWELLSDAPFLMQDLLAFFDIKVNDKGTPRYALSFTRDEWIDFYGMISDDMKSKFTAEIKKRLLGVIQDEDIVGDLQNKNIYVIIPDRIIKKKLKEPGLDARLRTSLGVTPDRYILPVRIGDRIIHNQIREINSNSLAELERSSLTDAFRRPSQPDNSIYSSTSSLAMPSDMATAKEDTNEQQEAFPPEFPLPEKDQSDLTASQAPASEKPVPKAAIELLRNNTSQSEAGSAIGSLIILARKAKRENQKLMIGLETDWIPAMNVKDSLQRQAIFALMKEIDAIGETLRSMGLDNVEIVRGSGEELAGDLLGRADKTHTAMHNIVVMASKTTIESDGFADLRNADENNRPFLTSIDPTKLIEAYVQYGEDMQRQLYVRLAQMLYMTLEAATGKGPPREPWIVYDSVKRTLLLVPSAKPIDYELLRSNYAAERTALSAA